MNRLESRLRTTFHFAKSNEQRFNVFLPGRSEHIASKGLRLWLTSSWRLPSFKLNSFTGSLKGYSDPLPTLSTWGLV